MTSRPLSTGIKASACPCTTTTGIWQLATSVRGVRSSPPWLPKPMPGPRVAAWKSGRASCLDRRHRWKAWWPSSPQPAPRPWRGLPVPSHSRASRRSGASGSICDATSPSPSSISGCVAQQRQRRIAAHRVTHNIRLRDDPSRFISPATSEAYAQHDATGIHDFRVAKPTKVRNYHVEVASRSPGNLIPNAPVQGIAVDQHQRGPLPLRAYAIITPSISSLPVSTTASLVTPRRQPRDAHLVRAVIRPSPPWPVLLFGPATQAICDRMSSASCLRRHASFRLRLPNGLQHLTHDRTFRPNRNSCIRSTPSTSRGGATDFVRLLPIVFEQDPRRFRIYADQWRSVSAVPRAPLRSARPSRISSTPAVPASRKKRWIAFPEGASPSLSIRFARTEKRMWFATIVRMGSVSSLLSFNSRQRNAASSAPSRSCSQETNAAVWIHGPGQTISPTSW